MPSFTPTELVKRLETLEEKGRTTPLSGRMCLNM
jgi:hypothetical protein